jgi:uncharacterized secreted protein with C-terminal beta-propeller domain
MEKKQKTKLAILFAVMAVCAILAIVLILSNLNPKEYSDTLLKFSSEQELKDFIKAGEKLESGGFFGEFARGGIMKTLSSSSGAITEDSSSGASDFSQTNIQVKGVDEPDIVKNDGKYIYKISGEKVQIIAAYPAENLEILSELNISGASSILINENKMIVFGNEYSYSATTSLYYRSRYSDKIIVYVYDISDRENPRLEQNISAEGSYVEARMIDNYVYLISSKYVYSENVEPPIYSINGIEEKTAATEVSYFDSPDYSYVFTSISSINIENGDFNSKVYLTGSSGVVFVSRENIYLTHTKIIDYADFNEELVKEVYFKVLPADEKEEAEEIWASDKVESEKVSEISKLVYNYSNSLTGEEKSAFDSGLMDKLEEFEQNIRKEMEKTTIHKIKVNNGDIEYVVAGEISGHLLNQFSMDEYDGYFRAATTTGEIWSGTSLNHIYVLDEDMKTVGMIADIAPGEKIYSARFIGNRAYLVTFKKVDPFFVIDLKNPENPKILGYLKIPGYSDYLHPYDENHIIGIGKEAVDASEVEVQGRNLDFAWYQGVKIALFDVSDVENPKEQAKFVIGDRGTDSLALSEHKAFLFDKEKKLLVLPINLAEINRSQYGDEDSIPATAYGEYVWNGAYVLNIDLDGISLRGKITHSEGNQTNNNYYWYDYSNQITRSLFMDNVLYTISNNKIKANNLENIQELKSLVLGTVQNDGYYTY